MYKETELKRIYIARNNEIIVLRREGVSEEEIDEKIAHYQDEIDNLIYTPRELEKKKQADKRRQDRAEV